VFCSSASYNFCPHLPFFSSSLFLVFFFSGNAVLPKEPFFRLALTHQYEGYLRGKTPLFPRPEYARLFGLRPVRGPAPLPSELLMASRKRKKASIIESAAFCAVFNASKDLPDPVHPLCSQLVDGHSEVEASAPPETPAVDFRLEKYHVCVSKLARRYQASKASKARFYFDHRAEEMTANLLPLAYAQGGWKPNLDVPGVFKDTPPVALNNLMPSSSFTGRP
jgi:hypothetical protein